MSRTATERPRVAVAMLGARRNYAVPQVLHAAGLLETFFTDLYVSHPLRRSSASTHSLGRVLDRHASTLPKELIRSFPLFGIKRAIASRLPTTNSQRYGRYMRANKEFCRLVLGEWPASANTFYVFNSAGLEILTEAKRRGLRCIVDQITAPWCIEEALLQEERIRWPEWESVAVAEADWAPLSEREKREWELADLIICGSGFVKNSVEKAGGPADKCRIVPYGVREDSIRKVPRDRHDRPLHVLLVGNQALRKGLPYLLQAACAVSPDIATFRAVGSLSAPPQSRIELKKPVPRGDIGQEYDWADLLVAPSISEGSANVCYEAPAQGIPVITTDNAGSVVRDAQEGFVVPVRSSESIAERIVQVATDNELWLRLSASATARAKEFTWAVYAERMAEAIRGIA